MTLDFSFIIEPFPCSNMGNSRSRSENIKRNKNHNRQKMFRFGVSFGRNDLNLEGHIQMGYNSKTIKNYGPVVRPICEAIVATDEAVASESESLIPENTS